MSVPVMSLLLMHSRACYIHRPIPDLMLNLKFARDQKRLQINAAKDDAKKRRKRAKSPAGPEFR
jgi:hypothetical protein